MAFYATNFFTFSSRWVAFYDENKAGLAVVPNSLNTSRHMSSWSASHYSLEELSIKTHQHQLVKSSDPVVHVHIDKMMAGLGGYGMWFSYIADTCFLNFTIS